MRLDLNATCSFGLEAVVARELKALECPDVKADNGSVSFTGDPRLLARANMWLRSADRVWVRVGRFAAHTFEDLFQGVRTLPWPDLLPRDARFPVEGMSHGSQLSSVPACQGVTKKAVVEAMKARYHAEWFPETGPEFRIRIFLVDDVCTVALDSSGRGLHRRGYRTLNAQAPLRETLASALVQLSYWGPQRMLVDPFCGSGTIPIEAAMVGLSRAPGLQRSFAWEEWPWVGKAIAREVRQEAEDTFDRRTRLDIRGYDSDGEVLRLARVHLKAAGLEDRGITFEKRAMEAFSSRHEYGVVITNPPYGERMGDLAEAERLYRELGRVMSPLRTWSTYVLTSHPNFEKPFGQVSVKRRKLFNGLMACTYYQFPGPRPPRPAAETPPTPTRQTASEESPDVP